MDKKISTTERFHIFILLMLSGGFMGAYSYYLKGGVFANAETANLLLLSLNLANGNWNAAFSVLIPIATFFLGTFFSELLSSRLKHRWPPILISCEILLLAVLSLLPEETPFTLYHVSIALISPAVNIVLHGPSERRRILSLPRACRKKQCQPAEVLLPYRPDRNFRLRRCAVCSDKQNTVNSYADSQRSPAVFCAF